MGGMREEGVEGGVRARQEEVELEEGGRPAPGTVDRLAGLDDPLFERRDPVGLVHVVLGQHLGRLLPGLDRLDRRRLALVLGWKLPVPGGGPARGLGLGGRLFPRSCGFRGLFCFGGRRDVEEKVESFVAAAGKNKRDKDEQKNSSARPRWSH
jgi:hypothetical protein